MQVGDSTEVKVKTYDKVSPVTVTGAILSQVWVVPSVVERSHKTRNTIVAEAGDTNAFLKETMGNHKTGTTATQVRMDVPIDVMENTPHAMQVSKERGLVDWTTTRARSMKVNGVVA